jgi:hypothetical protein
VVGCFGYVPRMLRTFALALLLAACGSKSSPAPGGNGSDTTPPAGGECIKGGCSGTVCTEPGNDVVTTCEYKAEYACYQTAKCERQADSKCGWTQSPELTACLANPPPMSGAPAGSGAGPQ